MLSEKMLNTHAQILKGRLFSVLVTLLSVLLTKLQKKQRSMTSELVIEYDGSVSQLSGSLLDTFVFLILHVSVDPFVSKHLNDFQKHILRII